MTNESKLILELINKVRLKMMGLGYSSHESKQRILKSDQSESEPLPIVKSEHVAPVVKEKVEVTDMSKSRIS